MAKKFPLKLKKVSNSTKWALFSFRHQTCVELEFEHNGQQDLLFKDLYALFNTPELLAQIELKNLQGRDNNQFSLIKDKQFQATAADKEMLLMRGTVLIDDLDGETKEEPFHYRLISRFKRMEGRKVILNSLHEQSSKSFTDPKMLIDNLKKKSGDSEPSKEYPTASISDFRIACEFLESRFYSTLGFGAQVKGTIYVEANNRILYLKLWGEDINQHVKPLATKNFYQELRQVLHKFSGENLDKISSNNH